MFVYTASAGRASNDESWDSARGSVWLEVQMAFWRVRFCLLKDGSGGDLGRKFGPAGPVQQPRQPNPTLTDNRGFAARFLVEVILGVQFMRKSTIVACFKRQNLTGAFERVFSGGPIDRLEMLDTLVAVSLEKLRLRHPVGVVDLPKITGTNRRQLD
jgi:hypothetical protein